MNGWRVPFLDASKLYTEYPLDTAIDTTLRTGRFVLREDLEQFEHNFAKFLGVKHFIGLNSGTDALMLALIAAGVGPGDDVITVANTFIATIQAIHHLGAIPVLVDVDEDGLMDMTLAEGAITHKTKAIIPVHLSGDMADMVRLKEIIGSDSIAIIEDAAQAIGATRDGNKAGATGFAGCFSFYPSKVLGTFGDAGGLATNDDGVAQRVRSLRNHGNIGKESQESYEFGWNSRLDNVWAAVLNVKLEYLDRDLEARSSIAEYYGQHLRDLPIALPEYRAGRVWQDYIIRSQERDVLNRYLKERGVGTLGTDLFPNHRYPGLNLDHFSLPYTEAVFREQIRIPCNHLMSLGDAEYVTGVVRDFYNP